MRFDAHARQEAVHACRKSSGRCVTAIFAVLPPSPYSGWVSSQQHPDASTAFNLAAVDAALTGTIFQHRLHHFAVIDSTNTRAITQAQAGAPAGSVYIADEQTAGRGRGGHTWHSEPDRGLYLTVLVRPALRSADVLHLSLAAGIAAAEAIRHVTGTAIDVRWPNDLVTFPTGASERSRKLGGILTEAASTPDGTLRYAAIGIGINLNQTAFPPELAELATSLRLASAAGTAAAPAISRPDLAIALLTHLDRELKLVEAQARGEHMAPALFGRFAAVSTWVRGKRVEVAEDGGYTGVTGGLTREGLLRVIAADGEHIVRHGGVREASRTPSSGHVPQE